MKKLFFLLAITMLLTGCNSAEKTEQPTAEITTTTNAETTVVTTAMKAENTSVVITSDTALETAEEITVYHALAAEYLTRIEKYEGFSDTLDMGADAVIADLDNDGSPELIIQICSMITVSAVFGIDENGAYRATVSNDSIISESTDDVSYIGEPPVGCIIDREPQYFARYWSGGSCGGEGGWARLVLSDREIKTEPLAQYVMHRDGFAQVYEYSGFESEEEYNKYIEDFFSQHQAAPAVKFRLLDVEKSEYRTLVLQQLEKYFAEYTAEDDSQHTVGMECTSIIAPRITDERIVVTGGESIDINKIKDLYGFDFEIEKDRSYEIGKEYCEKNYEGEELEAWRSRNYMDMGVKSDYIGTENADWLVNISYWHQGFQFACYENFLFVKDGKIAYETGIISTCLTGNYVSYGNDIYYATSGYAILHINMLNGEYDFIEFEEAWPAIADINEDYMIFGNGTLYVYDRKNKQIIKPSTDINWCGMDSTLMRLNGNIIEYSTYDDIETALFYNIETKESGKCNYTYYDGMLHYYENDEYTVRSPLNVASGEKYDGTLLTITRKSDGFSKTFDMTQLPKKGSSFTDCYTFQPTSVVFIEDWFIPDMDILEPVAINFETEEAVLVDYQIYHIYNLRNVNNRYFGNYLSEYDSLNENKEWKTGEIFFEMP